ncbi:TPA: helix-turn-helix transcriptional regulator [Pseudomonas aeruginosa]
MNRRNRHRRHALPLSVATCFLMRSSTLQRVSAITNESHHYFLRKQALHRQTITECHMESNPPHQLGRDSSAERHPQTVSLPPPGSNAYDDLPQLPKHGVLPFRRTIRRQDLRQIVPLSETTIYEMERRGEFPRRFNLTPRCVVWDLAEVEAWIEERKQAPRKEISKPDVRLRKTRPARAGSDQE